MAYFQVGWQIEKRRKFSNLIFHPLYFNRFVDLVSTHNYFVNTNFAEKFQCPNEDDHVYFRIDGRLELQVEFDTLLLGSLENGKVSKSKRYGQGFLAYKDGFMGIMNDGR